ncbi:hypothetical protein C2G38_2297956 [Gigaspora rosea]|uniref:Uncharacterized protein n=1 Tax=Gigaspora rosea TaxID=44941 RepID=A0A397VHC8_9GLOM|nr:hypothetical protein C2G38_2297956 [Gigaspora rosea]
MYSNENEYVGNKLLEDQKKSELDTNNSSDAKTTRITKRFLDGQSITNEEASNNEQDSSNEYPYTDSSHESDGSEHDEFISPTLRLSEDPFTENIIITNVPPRIPSFRSDLDVSLNNVNISAKFRQYINEAVSHATDKGLHIVRWPNTALTESKALDCLEKSNNLPNKKKWLLSIEYSKMVDDIKDSELTKKFPKTWSG